MDRTACTDPQCLYRGAKNKYSVPKAYNEALLNRLVILYPYLYVAACRDANYFEAMSRIYSKTAEMCCA